MFGLRSRLSVLKRCYSKASISEIKQHLPPCGAAKEYKRQTMPFAERMVSLPLVKGMVAGGECVYEKYYWPAGLIRVIQAPETLAYGALATTDNLPLTPLVFRWCNRCLPSHLNRNEYQSTELSVPEELRTPGLTMVQYLGKGLSFSGTNDQAVHPGLVASLLDDITARTSFVNRPNKATFTANFQLEYVASTIAVDRYVAMDSWITKMEGRKTYVASYLADAASGQVLARAKSLFVSEK